MKRAGHTRCNAREPSGRQSVWTCLGASESLNKVKALRAAFNTCKAKVRRFKPALWVGRSHWAKEKTARGSGRTPPQPLRSTSNSGGTNSWGNEVSEPQKKWTLNEMARVRRSTEDDAQGKAARENNIAEALKAKKVEEKVPSDSKEAMRKEVREKQNENARRDETWTSPFCIECRCMFRHHFTT